MASSKALFVFLMFFRIFQDLRYCAISCSLKTATDIGTSSIRSARFCAVTITSSTNSRRPALRIHKAFPATHATLQLAPDCQHPDQAIQAACAIYCFLRTGIDICTFYICSALLRSNYNFFTELRRLIAPLMVV